MNSQHLSAYSVLLLECTIFLSKMNYKYEQNNTFLLNVGFIYEMNLMSPFCGNVFFNLWMPSNTCGCSFLYLMEHLKRLHNQYFLFEYDLAHILIPLVNVSIPLFETKLFHGQYFKCACFFFK